MKSYSDLVSHVLRNGNYRFEERTQCEILSAFGVSFELNLMDGFPLLTTKQMARNLIFSELEWFINGRTDLRWLLDNNNHIWSGDAFKKYGPSYEKYLHLDPGELTIKDFEFGVQRKNPLEKSIHGDFYYFTNGCNLGPIYGAQWRGTYHKDAPDQLAELVLGLIENPYSRRHIVNSWNPIELQNMCLPPCWLPGSLVNVSDGKMIPIEEIEIGDNVITDDGSYQKVYDVMITEYKGDIYNFKLFGSRKTLSVTPNHPFLIKDKGYIEAKDILLDDYFAIPINKNNIIPEFSINIKDNQYSSHKEQFLIEDNDYWYLMGYFLGDGWLQRNKEEIYFVIANKDINRILPILNKFIGLAKLNNSGENCTKFVGKKQMDFHILSHFGERAYGKHIPDFVHDAPIDKINSFISGYCDADGCVTKNRVLYTTVSDHIAYGLQRLYAKVGIKASVYYQNRPEKTFIEGREVNQRNTYTISVESEKRLSNKYKVDKDYLWLKVDSIEIINDYECHVYNLSIENRHTYCVNNIINHNCHFAMQFYVRDVDGNKILDMMWYQRSMDICIGAPFNIASYALLLHLIAKEVNMLPGVLKCSVGDAHIYGPHLLDAHKQIELEPFPLPELDISDTSLWNFDYKKVKILNYQSHPKISYQLFN